MITSSASPPQRPPSGRGTTSALLAKATCLQSRRNSRRRSTSSPASSTKPSEDDAKTLAETCVRRATAIRRPDAPKRRSLPTSASTFCFRRRRTHHAESLYYLSRLFAQDGKFDKAADVSASAAGLSAQPVDGQAGGVAKIGRSAHRGAGDRPCDAGTRRAACSSCFPSPLAPHPSFIRQPHRPVPVGRRHAVVLGNQHVEKILRRSPAGIKCSNRYASSQRPAMKCSTA